MRSGPLTLDILTRSGSCTQMGVDYTYTVTAVNSYGQGAEGICISLTSGELETRRPAPTNLTAFGLNQSVVCWHGINR